MTRRRAAAVLLLLGAAALPGLAHVPFKSSAGKVVRWSGGSPSVDIVIQSAGSDDVPDASDDLAIRLALEEWQSVAGTSLTFDEDDSAASRARTDWESNDIHLVLFDENDLSGFFPQGSSTIALTPVQFNTSTGHITDADILFNGAGFDFTTAPSTSRSDIWAIATHELGHLVGFDHSGLLGSSLTPIASPGQLSPRRLTDDDATGIAQGYPATNDALGSIRGAVRRGSTGVVGANVWARGPDGRVLAQTMTNANGTYTLRGLPAGSYKVATAPFNLPTTSANFSAPGVDPGAIEDDFTVTEVGPVASAGAGEVAAPDLMVGTSDADTPNAKFPFTPVSVHVGDNQGFLLVVDGDTTGATVEVPDGGAVVSAILEGGGQFLDVIVTAAPDAVPGLYDLRVQSPGGADYHTGFLEVLPATPVLTQVLPAVGSVDGGAVLTLTGSGFGTDPLVLLGDVRAEVGALAEGNGSLLATAPPRATGAVDVIVVNAVGEEDRLVGAFTYVPFPQPAVSSLYPTAGSASGGTSLTLLGTGFDPGASVTVGGLPAPSTTFVSSNRLDTTTPALAEGAHEVSVVNPGPLVDAAPTAFAALAQADPVLLAVDPGTVSTDGGDVVVLTGSAFVDGASVLFGADPTDGTGGLPGIVTFVGSGELSVVTPALPPGDSSVLVVQPSGQVARLEAGLEVAPMLRGKDTFAGQIAEAGDVDASVLEGLPGTLLDVTVKVDKGALLLPKLVVRNPGGVALVSSDPADAEFDPALVSVQGRTTKIRKLLLPDLGRYTLEVAGLADTTGGYKLFLKEKLDPAVRKVDLGKRAGIVVTSLVPHDIELLAKSGSLLSGKLTGKDGVLPDVAAFGGPEGSIAEAVAGLIVPNGAGTALSFQQVPLEAFGAYLLSIGTLGADGTLVGSLKWKAPKSKVAFVE